MDLTKFALYTALAIVTYLMLLSWQEDSIKKVTMARTSSPT